MEATLTSKGQITLPKEIRDTLSLHTGDRISFFILSSGEVRLEPSTVPLSELKGILKSHKSKVVSLDEMKTAIRKRASQK